MARLGEKVGESGRKWDKRGIKNIFLIDRIPHIHLSLTMPDKTLFIIHYFLIYLFLAEGFFPVGVLSYYISFQFYFIEDIF